MLVSQGSRLLISDYINIEVLRQLCLSDHETRPILTGYHMRLNSQLSAPNAFSEVPMHYRLFEQIILLLLCTRFMAQGISKMDT